MKNGILTAGLVVALFAVAASKMAHPQIYSVTPQQGGKGTAGSAGSNGTNGTNGINGAGWIPAKLTTNTSGVVTWTFPAGCIGSGNPPTIVYGAEGPNPAAGTTVNVQTTGTVGVTTVIFQVTKQTATTVALLGLTIAVTASGTGVGATVLDVGCLAQ